MPVGVKACQTFHVFSSKQGRMPAQASLTTALSVRLGR